MIEDAFLADIAEHPEDDTPRLVYADWLDDHDQSDRAAFIRLQCEQAHMAPDDPRRPEWEEKARQLWEAHQEEWLRRFYAFRRGFVEEVCDSVPGYLSRADYWARLAPVQRVELHQYAGISPKPDLDPKDEVPALAACPWLSRWVELKMNSIRCEPAGFAKLMSSSHLARLERLQLNTMREQVRDAGLAALTEAPHSTTLRRLWLQYVGATDASADAFARSLYLARLTHLTLIEATFTAGGLGRLVQSPNLAHLEWLWLNGDALGDVGAAALARSPHLGRLTYLNLCGTAYHNGAYPEGIGDTGLAALSASPLLGQLTTLSLGHNRISDRGLEALLRSPYLRRLTHLGLRDTAITAAGVLELARTPSLSGLRVLELTNIGLDDSWAEALARSPVLNNLEQLHVYGVRDRLSERGQAMLRERFGNAVATSWRRDFWSSRPSSH
jgi:uncharacterized protein (TIGR02996 family)